jgi:hypothetical protein
MNARHTVLGPVDDARSETGGDTNPAEDRHTDSNPTGDPCWGVPPSLCDEVLGPTVFVSEKPRMDVSEEGMRWDGVKRGY